MARRRRRNLYPGRVVLIFAVIIAVIVGIVYGSGQIVKMVNASNNSSTWDEDPASTDAGAAYYNSLDETSRSYVDRIKETYSRNETLEFIIANIEKYPESLLDTLLLKPEMIEFIAGYATHEAYGFENCENIDVSGDYTPGEIPLFLQWDERWGYEIYGRDVMALNACGPTCMAMVYVGLTGDTSVNPLTVAKMCIENGYYYMGQGTGKELFDYGSNKLGLRSRQLSLTQSAVLGSLNAGHPVVVNVGPGDFTSYGHYIVLTGVAEDGSIIVNDPNSIIKSNMTWDLSKIISQTFTMWSVWKE